MTLQLRFHLFDMSLQGQILHLQLRHVLDQYELMVKRDSLLSLCSFYKLRYFILLVLSKGASLVTGSKSGVRLI